MEKETEDLVNNEKPKDISIIFRATKEDRRLIDQLIEKLSLKHSQVIRVAIKKLAKDVLK